MDPRAILTQEQGTYLMALNGHPATIQASTHLKEEQLNFDLQDKNIPGLARK